MLNRTLSALLIRKHCSNIPKAMFNYTIRFKSFSTSEAGKGRTFETNVTSSPFLVTMNNLSDNYGARIIGLRLGRGPGSKKGKTSGRGHKGYTARTGEPHRHFEGGQVAMSRRLPKHGFRRTKFEDKFSYINIDKLVYLIKKEKIDITKKITIKDIFYAGGVSKIKDGIKLLGRGTELLKELPPLTIEVSNATQQVIDAVKENGGSLICKYRTPRLIRYLTKPWKFDRQLLEPYPPYKKVKKLLLLEDKGAVYTIFF